MNEVPLPLWAEMLIAALVLGGATIALLGSLGLLRLKSYFERVHAPSIIATMGCWLIMWPPSSSSTPRARAWPCTPC